MEVYADLLYKLLIMKHTLFLHYNEFQKQDAHGPESLNWFIRPYGWSDKHQIWFKSA